MRDADTTVEQLREEVRRFIAERAWERYHTPRNLAVSLVIEAAELLEHFQWRTEQEVEQYLEDPEHRDAVAEEVADVLAYLLSLADRLGLELSEELVRKLRKNALKYPADQWRGRAH